MKIYEPTIRAIRGTGRVIPYRKHIASAIASASATIDFTGLGDSSFRSYRFILFRILPTEDNAALGVQFTVDGGATWIAAGYAWGNEYFEPLTLQTNSSTSDSQITVTDNAASISVSNDATEGGCGGIVDVYNMEDPDSGTSLMSKVVYPISFSQDRTAGCEGCGRLAAAGLVNGVRFLYSSDSIASGEIHCYGVE